MHLLIALMMEAASTLETSVNYQTTWRYNPEDSHLHTRRRENLKSYKYIVHWGSTLRNILAFLSVAQRNRPAGRCHAR
jgi:hypothetical protein